MRKRLLLPLPPLDSAQRHSNKPLFTHIDLKKNQIELFGLPDSSDKEIEQGALEKAQEEISHKLESD